MKNIQSRRDEIFQQNLRAVHVRTDQLFFWLLLAQWAFAVVLALLVSPEAWRGASPSIHLHVGIALVLGGVVNALPLTLLRLRPGWWLTRQSVAVAQMMWSGLLIHITGGRIETHFHIFGSLAFLAFYRDWRLLPTATAMVAMDHLARGFFLPESVYGIRNPEWWRFLEHAAWVAFEDVILFLGSQRSIVEMEALADREASLEGTNASIEKLVQLRTAELEQSMQRYRSIVENTHAIPWEIDIRTGHVSYIAPQAARLFGCTEAALESPAFLDERHHPDDRDRVQARLRGFREQPETVEAGDVFDHRMIRFDGRQIDVRTVVSPYRHGEPLRGLTLDVTKQKKLEGELLQAQKLESVGRLAAGVAHEINTPVQFVGDSIHFVRDAADDMMGVIEKLQAVQRSVLDGAPSMEAATRAADAEEAADLPYLIEHVPRALERSLEGLSRVANIVRSMKEFAHPDAREMSAVDINHAIRATLTIAVNEYKYVADVETHYGELPPVVCHVGEVNQVILNIVVNAAHAIADVVQNSGRRGLISVRTTREGDSVVIAISDTGGGIPAEIRDRIFDPFFTTKEVGKGTGQGLALARTAIVEGHHGELSLETEIGKGTTFFIRLPLDGAAATKRELAA